MFSEYGRKITFRDYGLRIGGIPRTNGAKAILHSLSEEELEKTDLIVNNLKKLTLSKLDRLVSL